MTLLAWVDIVAVLKFQQAFALALTGAESQDQGPIQIEQTLPFLEIALDQVGGFRRLVSLICAEPPTRDTESPTFTAGRTPL